MWQGKVFFAMLSLTLLSACSLQTTQQENPALDENERDTREYSVYFPFDSTKFDTDANTVVNSALAFAQQAQPVSIHLSGHTDRAGPAEYNMTLAKRRVDAVVAAFLDAGIAPGNMQISISGEDKPQTPTSDGQAEAANRRVEIAVASLAPPKRSEEFATSAPADCTPMPVYVAGTRVFSCVKPFGRTPAQ